MAVGRWTLLARSTKLARSSHCLAVSGGKVIVYSGELKPRVPVDAEGDLKGATHTFDLQSPEKSWSQTLAASQNPSSATSGPHDEDHSVPTPRVGAGIATINQDLYVWGGRGGVDLSPLSAYQSGVWKAKIGENPLKWERLQSQNEADAPEPKSFHVLVAFEGQLFIHAGCPEKGRLGTLHSFDPQHLQWRRLADAPEPGRGGTALAPVNLGGNDPVLLRFAGFAGYELGADHTLDIYHINTDKWSTVVPKPDPASGYPGARSVHGFVPYHSKQYPDAVAVTLHGERDASALGHAGAGKFWDDVWLLLKDSEGYSWKKVDVSGSEGPEGRGWFPAVSYTDADGKDKVVLHGGLLTSNERSDELWSLEID
ncbi:galactose oxidase [Sistotremastrum suecicum HHB10207 ss-3]|uniref:Galactose oxidase n=1 Tax=Sistotremastrum suecicum HHB10207 ss-3 TaxID=1314776 RepID=A0A166ESG8_9AGAM|nr:galactose oxidase [Sistotremastrum suecicum HHB10207 ss-3]